MCSLGGIEGRVTNHSICATSVTLMYKTQVNGGSMAQHIYIYNEQYLTVVHGNCRDESMTDYYCNAQLLEIEQEIRHNLNTIITHATSPTCPVV